MKKFIKAALAAVVLAFGLTSCFGPDCEINVVNASPYLSDEIKTISTCNEAGVPEVDNCTTSFTKGILTWDCLPGGYNASYPVYSREIGKKTVTVKGNIGGNEAQYSCDIEVIELPSTITVKLVYEDSAYKLVVEDAVVDAE